MFAYFTEDKDVKLVLFVRLWGNAETGEQGYCDYHLYVPFSH